MALDFGAVLAEWPLLLRGAGMTLALTAVAAVLGLALGIACAWARRWAQGPLAVPLRALAAGDVELVRNTPFIVQLFFVFFGLPSLGLRLSPEGASVLAMVINLGAYAAEIVRAGLDATPRGQVEAARSLALTELQVFWRVVLPPALARVWPAMVSQVVIVMLGSAVCGQIATAELSYQANLIHSRNFRAFEATIVATGLYLALAVGLRRLLGWAGPRWLFGRSLGGAPGRTSARAAAGYVQLFQGTPLLMQLFLAYFGLGLLGVNVSPWVAAGMALTLYASAFLTEIWRGCVRAIAFLRDASSTIASASLHKRLTTSLPSFWQSVYFFSGTMASVTRSKAGGITTAPVSSAYP